MRRNKAFTLVELLITSSILALIMLSVYSAFKTGLFSYRDIQETVSIHQGARLALETINKDLRNCLVFKERWTGFIGNNSEISFISLVDTYNAEGINQDYSFISYRIDEGRLMRLCRKGKESLNEHSEVQAEEIVADVESMVFNYAYMVLPEKSLVFKEEWDNLEQLPVAVRVRLILGNKTNQDFERTIFLML